MSVFGGDDRILLEEIVESTEQPEVELCGWVFPSNSLYEKKKIYIYMRDNDVHVPPIYRCIYIHAHTYIHILCPRWYGAVIWPALVTIGTRTRAGGRGLLALSKENRGRSRLSASTCLRERKRSCRRGIVGRRRLCRHWTAGESEPQLLKPAGRPAPDVRRWRLADVCVRASSWREPRRKRRGSPKVRFPLETQGRVAPRRATPDRHSGESSPRFSLRLRLYAFTPNKHGARACELAATRGGRLFSLARACDISSITARSRVRTSAFHSYVM